MRTGQVTQIQGPTQPPTGGWVVIVGAGFGALTLIFLMWLVLSSHRLDCDGRRLVVTILALGAGLASAFLGGAAAVRGAIPIKPIRQHPINFSVTGGAAVLIIVLVVAGRLFDIPGCG